MEWLLSDPDKIEKKRSGCYIIQIIEIVDRRLQRVYNRFVF